MALFEKSDKELREAFVRARFAEENVFGRPDIDQWLELQRTRQSPDESTWSAILARDPICSTARGRELELLYRCSHARSVPDVSGERHEMRERRERINPLLGTLSGATGCEMHFGYTHGDIFVRGRFGADPLKAWTAVFTERRGADGRSFTAVEPLQPVHVLDVIFATWLLGCRRRHDRISLASTCPTECARAFLCDALADEITRERAKAEADFDASVAVSADVTKIVHADWVVVMDWIGGRERFTVFNSKAFRAQKARRPDDHHFERSALEQPILGLPDSPFENDRITRIARLSWGRHRQRVPYQEASALLLDYEITGGVKGHRVTRIYITPASLCPSPLPEGGVEVMV